MLPRFLSALAFFSLFAWSATAEALPIEGRVSGLAGISWGGEAELGLRGTAFTLGGRTTGWGTNMPGGHVAYLRTMPVHPTETPAFGVSATVGVAQFSMDPGGRVSAFTGGVGACYQQAWGGLWWRVSPNLLFPVDVFTAVASHPWLELGWTAGALEVSLKASLTPLALGLRF